MANQVIYEVNASIDPNARDQYARIVQSHMKIISALPGFTGAEWFERAAKDEGAPDDGRLLWTIHYYAKDRASLDNYINGLAPKLRSETAALGDKVVAKRRILEKRS